MDDLKLKTENAEFGQYLRSVRQAKKISIRQLAKFESIPPPGTIIWICGCKERFCPQV